MPALVDSISSGHKEGWDFLKLYPPLQIADREEEESPNLGFHTRPAREEVTYLQQEILTRTYGYSYFHGKLIENSSTIHVFGKVYKNSSLMKFIKHLLSSY